MDIEDYPEPSPLDPDKDSAAVHPAPDDKRTGVRTDAGTPPQVTDQGDEEINREQSGIPN